MKTSPDHTDAIVLKVTSRVIVAGFEQAPLTKLPRVTARAGPA